MMFRRFCDTCGDLVVCSRDDEDSRVCSRCGGALVGPVAITAETYRERADILLSPYYAGAVAARDQRVR